MKKKYLPFLALLLAILFLIWVKKNQRGNNGEAAGIDSKGIPSGSFNRQINNISYSKHARCRMECRHIDEEEVKEIITGGSVDEGRIEENDKGKTYPLEGITRDKQHVRIVVAPHGTQLVIVTVIDLDKEWECDCK